MGQFFNFGILDVLSNPILRATGKLVETGLKGAVKLNEVAEDNTPPLPPELQYLLKRGSEGDANAQCILGGLFIQNGDFEKGKYWLRKSAEQDYPHAIEILDFLQANNR